MEGAGAGSKDAGAGGRAGEDRRTVGGSGTVDGPFGKHLMASMALMRGRGKAGGAGTEGGAEETGAEEAGMDPASCPERRKLPSVRCDMNAEKSYERSV